MPLKTNIKKGTDNAECEEASRALIEAARERWIAAEPQANGRIDDCSCVVVFLDDARNH